MKLSSGEHTGGEIGMVTSENDYLALVTKNHQKNITYFVSCIFMVLVGHSWVWMALANIDACFA